MPYAAATIAAIIQAALYAGSGITSRPPIVAESDDTIRSGGDSAAARAPPIVAIDPRSTRSQFNREVFAGSDFAQYEANYCYFSFGSFFSGEGLRAWLGDRRGSSARASPVLSGGSTLSVARVLVQTALPRESCSTLPLGPFCCRLKSGRRILTVSTMPNAPYADRYPPFEPKTQILDCPPTWSQNALCTISIETIRAHRRQAREAGAEFDCQWANWKFMARWLTESLCPASQLS
jgi:hypothetical protein